MSDQLGKGKVGHAGRNVLLMGDEHGRKLLWHCSEAIMKRLRILFSIHAAG